MVVQTMLLVFNSCMEISWSCISGIEGAATMHKSKIRIIIKLNIHKLYCILSIACLLSTLITYVFPFVDGKLQTTELQLYIPTCDGRRGLKVISTVLIQEPIICGEMVIFNVSTSGSPFSVTHFTSVLTLLLTMHVRVRLPPYLGLSSEGVILIIL